MNWNRWVLLPAWHRKGVMVPADWGVPPNWRWGIIQNDTDGGVSVEKGTSNRGNIFLFGRNMFQYVSELQHDSSKTTGTHWVDAFNSTNIHNLKTGWWFQIFPFSIWGRFSIWRAYFSDRLKPPTRKDNSPVPPQAWVLRLQLVVSQVINGASACTFNNFYSYLVSKWVGERQAVLGATSAVLSHEFNCKWLPSPKTNIAFKNGGFQ